MLPRHGVSIRREGGELLRLRRRTCKGGATAPGHWAGTSVRRAESLSMYIRRVRVAGAAALLASLVVIGPAAGSPLGAGRARPRSVETARTVVSDAREAMESERLAEVLRIAGIHSPSPTEIALDLSVVDGVAAPIAQLDAVIRGATARIRDTLPSGVGKRSFRTLMLRALTGRPITPLSLDPSVGYGIRDAAGSVAAAIDVLLPQIIGMPPTGSAGTRVEGCDLHDDAPDLCVASDADNVISTDYALVVDLGGDDTHEHSAGGASVFDNGLPVSVTIDVEGADVYDAPVPTASGSYVAQGASFIGAGFLVDAAGDDRYRIATSGPFGLSIGQGKGWHGVGVLADLQGADRYELSATGQGTQLAIGQGEATNGVGILLDPAGDDVHTVRAIATDFFDGTIGSLIIVAPPAAGASGIGAASSGVLGFPVRIGPASLDTQISTFQYHGLFLDGGGTDLLEVRSEVLDPKKDAYFGRPGIDSTWAIGIGIGYGKGQAFGTVVLGDGATDASIGSSALIPQADTASWGLGYGYAFGSGVVSDAGGDDVWRMSSDNVVERRGSLSPGCSCPPPATAETGDTAVMGLGYGELFGVGLVQDASGDDRYLVSATNSVDTELVERPGDPAPRVRASSTTGAVRVATQGAADVSGLGMLNDAGGDDRYEIVAASAARSTLSGAQSGHGEAVSVAGNTRILAQAAARSASTGMFRDIGGSDRYVTSSTNLAEANPPSDVQPGAPMAGVLASVDEVSQALFVDADGGLADQFSATPAAPACVGTRGQAQWVDCGGAGLGAMADRPGMSPVFEPRKDRR